MTRSRSPYSHLPGTRVCSRGSTYTPAISGCPCCREAANRSRKLKPWPKGVRCRHCGKRIEELSHWKQKLHDACRPARRESRDAAVTEVWRQAKLAEKRKTALCHRGACPNPKRPGRTLCEAHAALRTRQQAQAIATRKRLGICRDCTAPAVTSTYCRPCADRVAAASRKWRAKRKAGP